MKEKKKTIIGSLSSSLYTHLRYRRRIFFLFSFRGSKFNNSRHANPRYEETLLGNLLSVHGCVSIYFIYRLLSPPIRSSSQVDLWISLPVFFTILFESRVTFILARLSGLRARQFHVISSEKGEGKPVYSFFLSLRDRPLILIMGIGDFAERQVRCWTFHFCSK